MSLYSDFKNIEARELPPLRCKFEIGCGSEIPPGPSSAVASGGVRETFQSLVVDVGDVVRHLLVVVVESKDNANRLHNEAVETKEHHDRSE